MSRIHLPRTMVGLVAACAVAALAVTGCSAEDSKNLAAQIADTTAASTAASLACNDLSRTKDGNACRTTASSSVAATETTAAATTTTTVTPPASTTADGTTTVSVSSVTETVTATTSTPTTAAATAPEWCTVDSGGERTIRHNGTPSVVIGWPFAEPSGDDQAYLEFRSPVEPYYRARANFKPGTITYVPTGSNIGGKGTENGGQPEAYGQFEFVQAVTPSNDWQEVYPLVADNSDREYSYVNSFQVKNKGNFDQAQLQKVLDARAALDAAYPNRNAPACA